MQSLAIKVEVVGPWWNDLLPVVAIVLSVGTLIWTIWDKNRSLARVTAEVQGLSWSHLDEDPAGANRGTVDVAIKNQGRVDSTVVSSVILEVPMEKKTKYPFYLVEPVKSSHKLPRKIEPGETFVFGFDLEAIARDTQGDMSELTRCSFKVRSGHGNLSLPLPKDIGEYISHFAPEWKATEK